METFVTQFSMAGTPTNVTVQVEGENNYNFAIHLSDAFEGEELIPDEKEIDGTIMKTKNGLWQISGETKVALTDEDVQSLGDAIGRDYLKD